MNPQNMKYSYMSYIKEVDYSVSSRLLLNNEFSLVDTVNSSISYPSKDKMII